MKKYLIILALLSTNCFAVAPIGKPECVKQLEDDYLCSYYRYSVPTGWIVYTSGSATKPFFVPDSEHRWK